MGLFCQRSSKLPNYGDFPYRFTVATDHLLSSTSFSAGLTIKRSSRAAFVSCGHWVNFVVINVCVEFKQYIISKVLHD